MVATIPGRGTIPGSRTDKFQKTFNMDYSSSGWRAKPGEIPSGLGILSAVY